MQNLLSSSSLSKNLKIKIYRNMILSVLYGCETWSLTVREEPRLRVFENRLLRIFGPKRDEVTGEWRKLHHEQLNDLYSSPNIVRVSKSRRMIQAGHVAEAYTGFWWGNIRGTDHLEDLGVGGRIILKWIFRKWDVGVRTGSSWLMIGTGASTCECVNEPSDSIKCREFLD